MPSYSYECPECAVQDTAIIAVDDRDKFVCHVCSFWLGREVRMTRLPAAPAFTISGFTAANGYASK